MIYIYIYAVHGTAVPPSRHISSGSSTGLLALVYSGENVKINYLAGVRKSAEDCFIFDPSVASGQERRQIKLPHRSRDDTEHRDRGNR